MRHDEQIFRLASQKAAGILTDFKDFWRSPDGKDAARTCAGIYSALPKIKEWMFHGWPVLTFVKEGRDGEQEIIEDIRHYFETLLS